MVQTQVVSLRQYLIDASELFFCDRTTQCLINPLLRGTSLSGRLAELVGRSVLIATSDQLTTALALIELDGRARRIIILPPDTVVDHLRALIDDAEADAVVTDDGARPYDSFDLPVHVVCRPKIVSIGQSALPSELTEWVLLTSGTVGAPKMVVHSLASLTAPITFSQHFDKPDVWGTFYDIRRYGGLQIFLRAILGGASLVFSSIGEAMADHLRRLSSCGVTHLSGTPSHWRRALMSPSIKTISPRYVRLSGEIADQAVLDSLSTTFQAAGVCHAYASTEAGVAFEVNDRKVGFPAEYFQHGRNGVELRVVDGSLHIRSPRTGSHYLGNHPQLRDSEGFVDTGDIVDRVGDRYVFIGRRGGIINVGGQKVHPEEIEAIINSHPKVRMSLVRPKQSPVVGAIVVADVVLHGEGAPQNDELKLKNDILELCRRALPRHKVPTAISFVAALDVSLTGKLVRRRG